MELVATVGLDKESWGQVTGLINHGTWDRVVLIKNKLALDFPVPEGVDALFVDTTQPLLEIKKYLVEKLKPLLSEFDACVSIASGTGKEHMALISSLLAIPTGIRLVAFTKNGVEFVN
ncbi:MAG: hypothetical protein AABX53_00010 [Nanoarchaeota archaeon]